MILKRNDLVAEGERSGVDSMARPAAPAGEQAGARPPAASGPPSPLRRRLFDRLRNRPDSEHEQILIRLAIAATALSYLILVSLGSGDAAGLGRRCLPLGIGYLLGSALLLGHLLLRPGIVPARRYAGLLLDIATLTLALTLGQAAAAVFYPFYLWTTLGMGFRYGLRYLIVAAILSLISFALVIELTEYWHDQMALAVGLLIALVMLPGYASTLLAKLTDALARAEEASQTKSRFLASMSHELRTPLHAVIGMADLLRRTRLDDEQQDMVRTVRTAGHALLDMIADVLDIARAEAGHASAAAVEFDLHILLANVRAILHHQAVSKGLDLRLQIDPAAPHQLRGAARPMQQILINLVANAVKFTEQGSVTVRLTVEALEAQRVWLRIDVEDTGIGIPPEAQQRIFERFTQADESTTRRYGGSGLGLAIARQLAELMQGSITLRSQAGEGSCFTFQAPFGYAVEQRLQLHGRVVVIGQGLEPERLRQRLLDWGAEVSLAADLEQACVKSGDGGSSRAALLLGTPGTRQTRRPSPSLLSRFLAEPLNVVLVGGTDPQSAADYVAIIELPVTDQLLFGAVHAALAVPQMPGTEEPVTTEAAPAGSRPGQHILVAEDNRTNQRVIEKMLASGGHTVTVVGDGEQALDALEAQRFDLVLMDLNMPVLGGVEAVKLHRFATGGRDLPPFVALTADTTEETRRKCADAGFDAFVTKPVDVTQLLALVDRLTKPRIPAKDAPRPAKSADVVPHPRLLSGPQVLDRTYLDRLRQLDDQDGFVADVIQDFITDAEELLVELEAAALAADAAAFRDRAHALRSSAAHLGASAIFELCLSWRGISPTELTEQGEAHIARLRSEFERLRAALLTSLAELQPGVPPPAVSRPH